ncbi:MAG: UDP-2,3-diacylglucosamine diphosphatase LpxI [Magnetospirillum sp. WYHS-4]
MTGSEAKLGILAGGGDLPARLIDACRRSGRPYYVIAFEGQCDPASVAGAPHAWVRLGAAGTTLKLLRDAGVAELVMAGGIRRPSLAALRPDAWAAKFLLKSGAMALGDDGLLKALIRELEQAEGFSLVGVESLLPSSMAGEGVLGSLRPDDAALADVARGVTVAKGLGALDVGQGAVVQQGLVLAVEAAEGTDAMLERAGTLRREGPGGVLVKVKKPNQEGRADLPTIGVATVRKAHGAGLRGIAVEAGGALIVDGEAVARAADAAGLFLLGVRVDP